MFGFTKLRIIFLLFVTPSIGAFLRFINISPYRIYPDIYQNLIVAHNISVYGSVIGRLGESGMYYPDFLGWTRPGYAILIALGTGITHNPILAAQSISFICSVAALPLVYFLLKNIFSSRGIAYSGVLLLTFSFAHIVWSGIYLTEALSIFLSVALMTILFSSGARNATIGGKKDFGIGLLLAACIVTRYEYILFLVPIGMHIWEVSLHPLQRLTTILASVIFIGALVISFMFPLRSILNLIALEVPVLVLKLFLVLVCVGIIGIVYKKVKKIFYKIPLPTIIIFAVIVLDCVIVLLPYVIPSVNFLPGIRNFLLHDILLHISYLVGLIVLLKKVEYRNILGFTGVGFLLFATAYITINSTIERYGTHVLLFLLIPASVGLYELVLFAKRKKIVLVILIGVYMLQLFLSSVGLRFWSHGEWFETSYEEEAAIHLEQMYGKNDSLLLVSLPEPYYFFTGKSTYSLTNAYPFLYIDKNLDTREILIVEDMAMRNIFPTFSQFLDTRMQAYKKASFTVHRTYRFSNKVEKEKYPVVVYLLPLGVIKDKISSTYSR